MRPATVSWGRINSTQAAAEEGVRIASELTRLSAVAGFPLKVLPLVTLTSVEEAHRVHQNDYDVVLVYPATGSGQVLTACLAAKPDKNRLIFARHRNGPLYYWYEALSTRYLATATEQEVAKNTAFDHGPVTIHDVVIDDQGELLWRLRIVRAEELHRSENRCPWRPDGQVRRSCAEGRSRQVSTGNHRRCLRGLQQTDGCDPSRRRPRCRSRAMDGQVPCASPAPRSPQSGISWSMPFYFTACSRSSCTSMARRPSQSNTA